MEPNDQFIRLYEALKTQINVIAGIDNSPNMELAVALPLTMRHGALAALLSPKSYP
jgi:hypothetical protein